MSLDCLCSLPERDVLHHLVSWTSLELGPSCSERTTSQQTIIGFSSRGLVGNPVGMLQVLWHASLSQSNQPRVLAPQTARPQHTDSSLHQAGLMFDEDDDELAAMRAQRTSKVGLSASDLVHPLMCSRSTRQEPQPELRSYLLQRARARNSHAVEQPEELEPE